MSGVVIVATAHVPWKGPPKPSERWDRASPVGPLWTVWQKVSPEESKVSHC